MSKYPKIFFISFFLFLLTFSIFPSNKVHAEVRAKAVIQDAQIHKKKWIHLGDGEREGLQELLNLLKKSSTGKELIRLAEERALKNGKNFLDVISGGQGSMTDTALIRRFTPDHPEKMEFELRSQVYINRELTPTEALLDLAHELTHYVFRRPFNPYQDNFSLQSFIQNTIEGDGGEVAAYLTECRVLYELFTSTVRKNFFCHHIVDPNTGQFSRFLGIKQFYKVGSYYPTFLQYLKQEGIAHNFPHLDQDQAPFISSAYGVPYPVAAMKEYKMVMGKACANDRKRLMIVKENPKLKRPLVEQIEKSYFDRCENSSWTASNSVSNSHNEIE